MIKQTVFFSLAAAGFLIIISCGNGANKNGNGADTAKAKPAVNIPDFNSDSAYAFTGAQVAFGPRVPNTDAHKKCGEYLTSRLKTYTKDVIVQKGTARAFDGTTLEIKNIIASFNPETNNRIFICSHWDSRPFADNDPDEKNHKKAIPGANDGASGVGVIIEIARILSQNPAPVGIDLILFDAEDYGQPEKSDYKRMDDSWCLGSQYWSKNPHKKDYFARYGILLDMVGAENATFTMEGTSMKYAPDVMKKVWNTAVSAGYSDYFLFTRTQELTDDHMYINKIANIPAIDIIHQDSGTPTGFYKYWHTLKDDMDGINKNTLKAVGQTLLTVIYEETGS